MIYSYRMACFTIEHYRMACFTIKLKLNKIKRNDYIILLFNI